ncbi:MAG: class I SAM-dependent methyltransferase [Planctomycetes bacterium]|nr:class I SAM-dependent methyltransferase [Planctomycetota bacterium]
MAESPDTELHEANRISWNAATAAHNSHKVDQACFLRSGGSTLFPEEMELLGDVADQRLLHLQCNAGQDTLSLAQLGASVTGVDISDEAIRFARELARDAGIAATFHRADVYDWLAAACEHNKQFEIVFCSYGSICWLSDLARWAAAIVAILKPGGRFVIVDFHPVSMMFNERFELSYPYFGDGQPQKWDKGIQDYVAAAGSALAPSGYQEGVRDFENPHPAYEFQWHLGALFGSLLNAGLRIERFREYPYANGAMLFENMRTALGRRMYPPDGVPSVPLMFGLVASKPSRD